MQEFYNRQFIAKMWNPSTGEMYVPALSAMANLNRGILECRPCMMAPDGVRVEHTISDTEKLSGLNDISAPPYGGQSCRLEAAAIRGSPNIYDEFYKRYRSALAGDGTSVVM